MLIDRQTTLRMPAMKGGKFRTTVILLGGFFSVAFIALTFWASLTAQRNEMVRLAHSYSQAVMSFRSFYAETVVGRVSGLVEITHDYHDNPHALPIPATMTLDLVDYMNTQETSLAIAQISEYPFPWRAHRVLTEGQSMALDALLKTGEDMLTWTTSEEDGRVLHHAMAIRMDATCVGCHNSHPDSPRRDWKIGDLRAVQVVSVPFRGDGLLGNNPLRVTAAFVLLSFVIALLALFVMDSRVRRFLRLAHESAIERAEAATALEEQARDIRAILDNVLDGIITIDQRGIVASFSAAAQRIFGYPEDEVIGRNVSMLMPQPYRSEHDGYLAQYVATGVARVIGIGREVTGRRKDGTHFPLELSISETTHDGQPLFIGIVRDITERKRVEQLKNEFVSKVSHELRTPLTSIAGSLGLLAGGAVGQLPDQARPLVDIARTNSNRLTRLIDDLLDMEKMAAGKLAFDLRTEALMPLLHQALEANQTYAEQLGVRFALRECGEDVAVRVDRWRLMQVLSNLLSNAAKYAPQDSVVQVSACVHEQFVRVAVKDSGPGIPEAFHDGVFQRFSQADSSDSRQKGGTGLGLAITKELIEHMGGRVGFESIPGAGATFYFDLPIVGSSADTGDTITSPDTTHGSAGHP